MPGSIAAAASQHLLSGGSRDELRPVGASKSGSGSSSGSRQSLRATTRVGSARVMGSVAHPTLDSRSSAGGGVGSARGSRPLDRSASTGG